MSAGFQGVRCSNFHLRLLIFPATNEFLHPSQNIFPLGSGVSSLEPQSGHSVTCSLSFVKSIIILQCPHCIKEELILVKSELLHTGHCTNSFWAVGSSGMVAHSDAFLATYY